MKRWLVAGAMALLAAAVVLALQLRNTDAPASKRPPPPAPIVQPPPVQRPVLDGKTLALGGTVRDGAGAPIAGAQVCAIGGASHCTQTARDGHYDLDGITAAVWGLSASAARYRPIVEPLDKHAGQTTIDLVLAHPGALIRGTIRDLAGAPIASTRITATGTETRSDPSGAFELWVAAGRANVTFEADGFAITHRPIVAPGTVEVVLAPEGVIAGTVVDDATSAPIAHARIAYDQARDDVETAADGGFVLSGLAPGRYQLLATTPRAYGATFEIPLGLGQQRTGVVIRVRPAHQVSVRVSNPDGSACIGQASLDAWGRAIGTSWRDGAVVRIDGVPTGRYLLDAGCGGIVHATRVVTIDRDVELAILASDQPTGALRGTITRQGRAVDDELHVWFTGSKSASRMTTADAEGHFEVAVPADRYTVRAGADVPETEPVSVEIEAGKTIDLPLVLPPDHDGRLLVSVVDRDGHPLPYAQVTMFSIENELREDTDRDGQAVVSLPPAVYTLRSGSFEPGASSAHARVLAGADTPVRVVVDIPTQIHGSVVDENARPVANAVVSFETDATRVTTTATDGTFSLAGGSPGNYVALVAYRLGDTARAAGVAGPDRPAKLMLGGAASIEGTVTRPDGSVPDRFDVILKPTGATQYGVGRETRSFLYTNGAFRIDELPAGTFKLGSAVNGVELWTDLVLTAGEHRANLRLPAPALASITGVLVDAASNAPIGDARIRVRCDREGVPLAFVHRDQRSSADGHFELRDLPPGACTLDITPPTTWSHANRDITVPDNGSADVGTLTLARATHP